MIFKKKKVRDVFPSEFGVIMVNDVAKTYGIEDDENKKIVLFKNGKPIEIIPYSEAHVNAIQNVQGIPIEEEITGDEEFEFDTYTNFGFLNYKK